MPSWQGPRPDPAPGPAPDSAQRFAAVALPLLYFLSGASGLGYEVLWARMLSAQFGVSIIGIAITVAAFLLGLGGGSLLGARWSSGGSRPPRRALAGYALLEGIVALYALALPALTGAGAPAIDGMAGNVPEWQWSALQGGIALVLLALPAVAIGASFPLVLRSLPWTPALLGRLYAVNTLGAAAGALLSLALLAALGWSRALQAIALCGALVAAAAFALSRALAPSAPAPDDGPAIDGSGHGRRLLGYAAVGAAALALEIGWTRLYGMVMLRTEYVLAIILAVYLLGTAIGSALAARARALPAALIPLAACAFTLLGLAVLAPFSAWLQTQGFATLAGALGFQALALGACTLPTTIALGAWLPALAQQAEQSAGAQRRLGAQLYAANCLGGAVGALLTVLVVIPAVGTAGSIALAAVGILALGLALGAPRALALLLPPALLGAWLLRDLPTPDRLLGAPAGTSTVLYQFEDALTLNHVTAAADGQRTLLTDLQHLDAASDPAAVALQADQARLPLLLHPHPRSVLFLGLGTGISASASLAWPELRRTAVEISPGAIAAARDWFAPVNGGVMEKMRVVHDDARHFLAANPQTFDVIVGDLFHPDLAGMGNLLSVEQFTRARQHLADGGIFAQWLALNQFDRESLHVVLRSFLAVFPDGQVFLDGAHLAMVGGAGRPPAAAAMAANIATGGGTLGAAMTAGEGSATWLGRYWGPIAAGVGAVQSDARPVIEFRLPRLRYEQGAGGAGAFEAAPLAEMLLELLRRRPDAQRAAVQLGVAPGEQAAFASAYAASELAVQSWLAVLGDDAPRARQLVRLGYEANPQDRWIASALADDLLDAARQGGTLGQPGVLERILRIYPDHLGALRALWQRQRAAAAASADAAVHASAAATLARLQTLAPLDREAAAIGVRSP